MAAPSVLITGYPKFSNFEHNVSEKILSLLKQMDFGKTKIFTELLSVDEFGSNLTANRIKSGETFDVIIHLGFSSKSKKFVLKNMHITSIKCPNQIIPGVVYLTVK